MKNTGILLTSLLCGICLSCSQHEQVYPNQDHPRDVSIVPRQSFTSQTWSMTGSLQIARSRHTASTLPDGTVLVTGGIVGTLTNVGTTETVEIYDPGTGIWSMGDDMLTPRSRHTATLLQDGRVLIVGGRNPGGSLSAVEIYDVNSGNWSQTGSMHVPRDYHSAALLADGRVIVTGGLSGGDGLDNPAEKSSEIYDPQTGMWTVVKHMFVARWGHSATLLNDGTVLVAGGTSPAGDGVYTVRTEIYDPVTDRWKNVDGMTTPRGFHAAIRLNDGNVLVAGGYTLPANTPHRTATTEVFLTETQTWVSTGSMILGRGAIQNAIVQLSDNHVLVAGSPGTSTELYAPDYGYWSTTGSMEAARNNHTLTLLQDGTVLATGGENKDGFVSAAEAYDPF